MTDFLLLLYDLLPGWLVAGTLIASGGLWIVMHVYIDRCDGMIRDGSGAAVLVGVALMSLAMFWAVGPSLSTIPLEARAGLSRLLIIALAVTLWAYAIGVVRAARQEPGCGG